MLENETDNHLILQPRGRYWLFACWNLSSEYLAAAKAAGGQIFTLRLYDVTCIKFDSQNTRILSEVRCAESNRSIYIFMPKSECDYLAEIGYRAEDQWLPVARSNRVMVF